MSDAIGPPFDFRWVEFDRVQWLHDHLPPEAANVLARLITEDDDDNTE